MPERPSPSLAAALGQGAVLLTLLAVLWAGLLERPDAGTMALLVALAAVPALATLSPRAPRLLAVAATLASAVAAVLVAAGPDVGGLLAREGEAWRALGSVLPDGLAALNDTTLPAPPDAEPALAAVVELALWVIASCVAWLTIAARNALAGVVAVGVALAYRWTVVPPARPLAEGALALAAVLAVLFLGAGGRAAGRTRTGWAARALRAAVVGVLLVGVAVGAAAPGRDAGGWVDWRSWDLTPDPPPGPPASIDLLQRYGQLQWPETPSVVMRVRAERALPMKAATFELFDGLAFEPGPRGPSQPLIRTGDRLPVPAPPAPPATTLVRQDVELAGATSPFVLAGGTVVGLEGRVPAVAYQVGDRVEVQPPFTRGSRYRVTVRVTDPGPRALLAAREYDSGRVDALLTQVTAGLGGPVVTVPVWGSGRPAPSPAEFGPYAGVYRLARRVVGDARTPYAAVNRIESYLRREHGYDEAPPYPPAGTPPLADFLLGTRRGFCQHFAGAMALMLRMNGIPARVAVGFASGRYDADTNAFEIWDRDAHSWVEVLFPRFGWLPFDPTPGRFAANRASVSSPDYAPRDIDISLSGITRLAVGAPQVPAPPARPPAPPARAGEPGGGPSPWWLLVPLGLALLAAPAAWRAGRRAVRRRAGDERRRTLGALRELEDLAGRLGAPPHPAATSAERAAALRAVLGVDAERLYGTAAAVRFAGRRPPPGTAAAAWRDLAALRRAARRRLSWRRRLVAALRPAPRRRATLGA